MAKVIRKVDYFYVESANQPGEAAKMLQLFHAAGVNLLVFSGFPTGRRAQLDFVPEDPAAFKTAARRAGLRISARKSAFLIQGDDRPGAVADVAARLAAAKVNVTAMDAVGTGGGRYGAILWVKPPDLRKASKALGLA